MLYEVITGLVHQMGQVVLGIALIGDRLRFVRSGGRQLGQIFNGGGLFDLLGFGRLLDRLVRKESGQCVSIGLGPFRRGELKKGAVTWPAIHDWVMHHPDKARNNFV